MPLDIHSQRLILIIRLTGSLGQMDMDDALAQWPLDIELEAQMVGAPLVRLLGTTDVAIAGPSRPRPLAVGRDLRAGAEQFLAAGVGADKAGCAIEVGGF